MSEPYDNRFDGYLGWNDDEEYAQFQRDYEEWCAEHLRDQYPERDTAHLDAMDRLGRKP